MICPICLKAQLEKPYIIDREKIFRCISCNAEGTYQKFLLLSLKVFDNRWAFYHCVELKCRCFYRANKPIVRPVLSFEVDCPVIQSKVTIDLIGVGSSAASQLAELPMFPVDLFHRPYKLDPHLSRTVSEEMMVQWADVVSDYNVKLERI